MGPNTRSTPNAPVPMRTLDGNQAVASVAYRLNPLIAAHIQIIGKPQQRNQVHQRAPLLRIQGLIIRMHRGRHRFAVISAEIGDHLALPIREAGHV